MNRRMAPSGETILTAERTSTGVRRRTPPLTFQPWGTLMVYAPSLGSLHVTKLRVSEASSGVAWTGAIRRRGIRQQARRDRVMKTPRSRSERGRLPVPSGTVARFSVPDHQGLTQSVCLQLELVDPVLDDVADAHDPGEPAVLDHGQVTDAMARHQRHDGGDPVARRAREHPCRHHPRHGE